jgi:uncharacterized phiE125 gp8 family phage protein
MSTLRIITAPATEPVTVTEEKLQARISHAVEDTTLAIWIKSARILAEIYQRRAYITQTVELSFDRFPCMPVCLPRSPLIALKTIKYTDSTGTETTLYDIDTPVGTESDFIIDTSNEPGRVTLASNVSWPSVDLQSIDSVKFRYTAGYGTDATTTPETVKDAIFLYCTYRYENRTGEVPEVPKQFYDLLYPDRIL